GIVASSTTGDITAQLVDARVNENMKVFEAIGNNGYSVASSLAPVIDNLRKNSVSPRERIIGILYDVLEANPSVMGVWTCWEPNAFDGKDSEYVNYDQYHDSTGRYIPYIYRDGNTIIGQVLADYTDPVAGLYYLGARDSAVPYATDPYSYSLGSTYISVYSISIPIFEDGAVIGVAGVDLSLEEVSAQVNAGSILDDGYLFVVSPGGYVTTHKDESLIMDRYDSTWFGDYSSQINEILKSGGSFDITAFSDITNSNINLLGKGVKIGETERFWLICGVVPQSTANAASNALLVLVIGFGAGLITVIGVISYFLVANRLRKLPFITAMAEKVAAGDINLDIELDQRGTKNEITLLERSFAHVIGVLKDLIAELNKVGHAFTIIGDIESRVDAARFTGAYNEVAASVNGTVDGLVTEVLMVVGFLDEFANGKFDLTMKPLPGKKELLKRTIDKMSLNLQSVSKDIGGLVSDAIKGKLSSRVDASSYKGGWAALLTDMNTLMETVSTPIKEAEEVLKLVAEGHFTRKMSGDYSGDFLVIKNSINNTVTNIMSYINEISKVLSELAANNLNQSIEREYVGSFSDIKNALNNIIITLNKVIGEMNSASEQVAAGAKQISDSSMTLAQGATEQASSVEELTATVLAVNDQTQFNAENAKKATLLSSHLMDYAKEGNTQMKDMLNSMAAISEASGSISKIIEIIKDIAFQTNLLALNASIEAAHAGVHGAGFSVVAEEVRSLAVKSQEAANDTTELIETSIRRVSEGTDIANKTDHALEKIVSGVSDISGIITDISKASDEQALAISQINDGVSQIAQVVQDNSATSEESAAAAQELSSQSEVMRGLVSVFKVKP
ncbi:MAG: methyl-accepting chemotaxis protein, partial [Clostridiales bacterium]|nr:methyl-accepting chemotaxis protein [Clostridiales bacterium]